MASRGVVPSAVGVVAALLVGCGSGDDDDGASGADVDTVITFVPAEPMTGGDFATAIDVVTDRIEAIGVETFEVDRDGDDLVVRLVGRDDVERVRTVVQQQGELRFRPVLVAVPDAEDVILSAPEDALDEGNVTLRGVDGMDYALGPPLATGAVVESAEARLEPAGWQVALTLREGVDGIELFNEAAAVCFERDDTCPSGQLGIVLDSTVESAPMIQEPSYRRDQITISGSFESSDAEDLALVLTTGTLPVRLRNGRVESLD